MNTTEPARRHLCEICNEIFECHLCTIRLDHNFHSASRIQILDDWTTPVLVCEECAVTDNCRRVESGYGRDNRGVVVNYYDYLTGETVRGRSDKSAPDNRVTKATRERREKVFTRESK